MVQNDTYNLALQLTQHLKSLWRIREKYGADTACASCKGIWGTVRADLERHVESLQGELKNHLANE